MGGKQRYSLKVMPGKKDVYLDGKLHVEGLAGDTAYIDVHVSHYQEQHIIECCAHGRPYIYKPTEN